MEVSAIKYTGAMGAHGRSPLLRLQSDERLVGLVRRGNQHAYEALVSRYSARLLAFCRHMLGSREDAEDVLQEVFAAAFNAMLADERPINVRPWLYRIARNRSLNHLRRTQPIGVDSMDVHLSEGGQTTAEKVHKREEFRQLISDVQGLPETQRTALLLREIDALAYEQIAEAMETTVPSVKSLLVRARVGLAEAAEARRLTCEEVRLELGEVAEGLMRMTAPVRRHLRTCERCSAFRAQLKDTNRALAVVFPIGPLYALKQLILAHTSAHAAGHGGATAGASAAGGGAAGTAAGTAAGGAAGGAAVGSAGGLLGAGTVAVATKAAAGLAAAAIVTAGAIEVRQVDRSQPTSHAHHAAAIATATATASLPGGHASARTTIAHHTTVASRPSPVRTPHRSHPARHVDHTAVHPVPVATTAPATPKLAHVVTAPARTHPAATHPVVPIPVVRPVVVVVTPTSAAPSATPAPAPASHSGATGGRGAAGESGPGAGETAPQGSPPPPSEAPQGSPPPPSPGGSPTGPDSAPGR